METLEQELNERIMAHKFATCMSILIHDMKEEVDKSDAVNIPSFLMEDIIEEKAKAKVQLSMMTNTFEDLYESSWERLCSLMSEVGIDNF